MFIAAKLPESLPIFQAEFLTVFQLLLHSFTKLTDVWKLLSLTDFFPFKHSLG